jgi:hypothetical protein
MKKLIMLLCFQATIAAPLLAYTYTFNNRTNSNATIIITYSRGLKRSVIDIPGGGSKSDSDTKMYATSMAIKTQDGKETNYNPDTSAPRSLTLNIQQEGNTLTIKPV